MAEQIAAGAAGELYNDVKGSVNWICNKYDYANNQETYLTRMREKANVLYKRKNDVEAEAKGNPRMQPTEECQDWILRVDKTKKEVRELETEYKNAKKCKWASLQLLLPSNLSQRMEEMSQKLHDLWDEERNFLTRAVVKRSPERVRLIHPPKTEDKPSLHGVVEKTIDLLRDQEVKRIGLWGTPGIGKTTIMQNLNDNENVAQMFDIVIWVTVSKDSSIENLQRGIAQRLKLNMEGITGTDETADVISEKLEGRRYLLLLDEVWEVLDLDALGIRDNQMDSKVVLATRDRHICYNMETDEQIIVKQLSNEEAWKMFREKVGRKIDRPGIEAIAQLVARECAGLPILVDRIAKTFREMDNYILWRNGLERLQTSPNKFQGMEEVLELLSICYERLEGDRKDCFVYSALYPEDCQIYKDYLLECWRAEGFTHGDQGHTVLDDLIKVSLLDRGEKMKHIRMNKVLRNMALRISSRSKVSKFLVRSHEELEEPPNEEEWVEVNRISLMDNKLHRLPDAPGCKNLSTLLLQRNSDLTIIPSPFFRCMGSLRILDLHRTGIKSLPTSLSCLTCLRALYLNSCKHLEVLPPIVEALENLEVLDIRGTGITNLPRQIVKLIRLRCLRISSSNFGARYLNNHKVISSLSSLEELSVDVDLYAEWWEKVGETITGEVATLKNLTSLSFFFPKVESLNIFVSKNPSWKKNRLFFKFQFFVGYHDPPRYAILDHFEYEMDKCLKFVNGNGVNDAISEVLAESFVFELIGHKGVIKLSEFGIKSMSQLRGCLIERCDDIETIIDGKEITTSVLKYLEKMYIKNVSALKSIWEGPIHSESLGRLTTLMLQKCPKLKTIFSNNMIQQLSKLEYLSVQECFEIEVIIMESQNGRLDRSVLPRLKTLVLSDLPKLRSMRFNDLFDWPSLERLTIFQCNSLTRLPFNDDNGTKLRSIECQESWWNALQEEVAIKQRLVSICNFK